MKVVINPEYASYAAFVNRVPDIFAKEGKTIYKARNEIKVFDVDGTLINVKQYKIPIWINRIIYTFFRSPKAVRAYEYALRIMNKGICTADPIAYILFEKEGLIHQSYFISMQLKGETLYEIGKEPVEANRDIFEALGRYVADLHNVHVYHVDFSPGNILYERTDEGIEFSLIDINRMRFGYVSLKKGCANFARLWGRESAFRLMAQIYAERRRLDVKKCTHWVLYYRNRFWKKYGRKHPISFEM